MSNKGLLIGIFAAAAITIAATAEMGRRWYYPSQKGHDLLTSMGYTDITEGRRDYFNMCGKNIFARTYSARNPSGKHVSQTVCFSWAIGPYREPLFRP